MSFIVIKDLTFNKDQFSDVLEYLDAYVLTQKLDGFDLRYEVVNKSVGEHKIVVSQGESSNKTGFSIRLYENQNLKNQGVLSVVVWESMFDIKSIDKELKERKYTFKKTSGKRNKGTIIVYGIALKKRMNYIDILEIFGEIFYHEY